MLDNRAQESSRDQASFETERVPPLLVELAFNSFDLGSTHWKRRISQRPITRLDPMAASLSDGPKRSLFFKPGI